MEIAERIRRRIRNGKPDMADLTDTKTVAKFILRSILIILNIKIFYGYFQTCRLYAAVLHSYIFDINDS